MPTFTGGRDTEIKWSKRAIPKADTRCRKEVHWEVVTDRGAIGLIQKFIMKFISQFLITSSSLPHFAKKDVLCVELVAQLMSAE